MRCYLCKSLNNKFSDKDIENKYGFTSFTSFDTIIKLLHKRNSIIGEVIAFKITEKGIELLYE